MRRQTSIMWTGCLACLLSAWGPARGDTFSVSLPDFERLYGGFVGDTFQATTYDFGTAFSSVSSATLSLSGFTDIPNSTVSFLVDLENVMTPEVDLLVVGPPLFPPFSIDIPLAFDAEILDGAGPITININTSGPGADLSSTVQMASLTFEGVPIPEPGALCLLVMGVIGLCRQRV